MVRVGCIVVGCLLLAAAPARAQNSDIFREEAPPPPVAAPTPRPAPRPYAPPAPEVVAPAPPQPQPAVAPVPSLPSAAQIWAQVRQVAASEDIGVPLASSPPFDMAGTPPQYRALLGAWGPGTWQGDPAGDKVVLVIQSVDGDGVLHAVLGKSAGPTTPRLWTMSVSPVAAGNRFTLQAKATLPKTLGGSALFEEDWQIELRPDGKLYGFRNGTASTVVLSRLQ